VRTRRAAPLALLAAALAGCGGGGSSTVTTDTNGIVVGPSGLLYTGTTSQQQPVRIEATAQLLGSLRMQLACKDGSSSRVTLTTSPVRPKLEPDGSFYYQESGTTQPREFPGFGSGRYRGAMNGTITGRQGSGTAVFRISFKETNCRAAVRWDVRKAT